MKKKSVEKKQKRYSVITYNIIGVAFLVILFFALKSHQGYGFVFKMLEGNYKVISKYRNASLHKRYAAKMGNSYNIFEYINSKTPSDAVIYIPGGDAFKDKTYGTEFSGEPFGKGWATRFLYPRKIVLESEYDKSSYSKDITHVLIVNKVGAEILPYKLDEIPICAVFPMKPNVTTNNK